MMQRYGELDATTQLTDQWVLELPADVRGNQARLHTTAANLLRLACVRSVIINEGQSRAIVRLHCGAERDVGAVAELPLDEAVVDAAADSIVSWIDPRDDSLCFIRLPGRTHGWRRALFIVTTMGLKPSPSGESFRTFGYCCN